MRGVTPTSAPSSPSFVDWYKCGSRTRDTRFIRPLLYPSELTCGGMKQSVRAVRACATRMGQRRARWAYEPTVAARSMFRPRHETSAIRSLKTSISFSPTASHRPKRRDPGRQRLPGSQERLFRGLPSGQPRNSRRLTHQDFQRARGCTAGIHEIPGADFQRRALPRAKGC